MSNWKLLNQSRIHVTGYPDTDAGRGFNGAFQVKLNGMMVDIIASDGGGWQHASVKMTPTVSGILSAPPNWSIMCQVKDLFWEPEDCVIQYHPPQSRYVNRHPGVLHLWRPAGKEIPMPPVEMV